MHNIVALYQIVAMLPYNQKSPFCLPNDWGGNYFLLFVIGSINWTYSMTHTQHELPQMVPHKMVISGYMVTQQQYGMTKLFRSVQIRQNSTSSVFAKFRCYQVYPTPVYLIFYIVKMQRTL